MKGLYKYDFNHIWNIVKRTMFGKLVQRECDLPLALDVFRSALPEQVRAVLGQTFLKMPALTGAGYGDESRRFLVPVSQSSIATTGANTVNFNVFDFTLVSVLGFVWTVAGTVTALVMDFDLHDQLAGGNLLTDKLDGTNGVITSPTVADQAIGDVLYKNLGETGPVLIQPGYSVQAIVTTTTTAGNGNPFLIGYPKPEEFANLGSTRKVTSA